MELSPEPFYAKLHMATALPDNSIQPVSDSQVRSDAAQSCRCEYTVQWQLWVLENAYCVFYRTFEFRPTDPGTDPYTFRAIP